MDLNELKKRYELLAKKYNLPAFNVLNEQFEIEKADKDTDLLARNIRKILMDKIINGMSFLEMLLNPANAPRIYLFSIKSLNADDKKTIDKIYSTLGTVSLKALPLETNSNEKAEIEMIKEILKAWHEAKPELSALLDKIASPKAEAGRREKSYFG